MAVQKLAIAVASIAASPVGLAVFRDMLRHVRPYLPRESIHHLSDILFCVKLYANAAQKDRRNPGDPRSRPEDPQMLRSRTGEIQETHAAGPRICHNPRLHAFSLDRLWDSPCSCSLTQSSCLRASYAFSSWQHLYRLWNRAKRADELLLCSSFCGPQAAKRCVDDANCYL